MRLAVEALPRASIPVMIETLARRLTARFSHDFERCSSQCYAKPWPDYRSLDQIFTTIGLPGTGLTVLVVEQNAHGALQISDTGIVMELGRISWLVRQPR